MRINLKFTDQAKAAVARHKGLGGRIRDGVVEAVRDQVVKTQNFVVSLLNNKSLRWRSGSLARDVDIQEVKNAGGSVVGAVVMRAGPSEKYQKLQEFGGTITPKNAKALAVPLDAAMTGSGVIKGKYNTDNIRSLNLVLIKNETTGKAVLAEIIKMKTKDKVIPIFALVGSVTVRGAHYMEDGRTFMQLEMPRVLEARIQDILQS
jgi:hypothetical protein